MFTIRRVEKSNRTALETLGTKPKFWFSSEDQKLLFKAEERDTGEDWAEKIVCHLCKLIGIPHVHYELADLYEGNSFIKHGVICETCAHPSSSLILGNQLLFTLDPDYPVEKRRYKESKHTVNAVCEVLQRLLRPSDDWMSNIPDEIETALDVFVGYVMLDAWVANQDRHHENWGALQTKESLRLAPTFDHGAALARNLSDEERKERLNTKDCNFSVKHFAKRARSAFYLNTSDTKALGTVEAFLEFTNHSRKATEIWLNRLAGIEQGIIEEILNNVPNHRMTGITKEFTLQLLWVNKNRLLEERG